MPRFTVIRASAGSGKTFSLTQEYLRLILKNPANFRHILAVTFTNKATEEMKTRIIRELFLLSSGEPTGQLEPLIRLTGLSQPEISQRAKATLRLLLHRYAWFSVNTIDTFFQRIIRNFTRELGIQEGYFIELDTEQVLTEVIDSLLVNAEHDHTLLTWLSLFAESLIEKGENWNLKRSIRKLGNEIFREEFKNLGKETVELICNREFMTGYRKELHMLNQRITKEYRDIGRTAAELIHSHGLTVDDFNRKSSGPAGFLIRLADGEFKEPSAFISEATDKPDRWYTRTSPKKEQIESIASSTLMPLLQKAIDHFDRYISDYNSTTVILRNLFSLGILIDLSKLADSWCSDNNTFLLPEAPVFLNRIIDGNDTPFIFEKAGCWYHHFMIDEFQDTSSLQWSNFKPLISNSLSQNYDNLAVGDIKQSIYRWRNSSWDILQNQIQEDFLPGIINPVYLRENRRSALQIVEFNNSFFPRAAEILQEEFENRLSESHLKNIPVIEPITSLYSDLLQSTDPSVNHKGYVSVQFLEENEQVDFFDEVNLKVVSIIYGLLDRGYKLKDIAILTRKNDEASDLAEFLLNYDEAGRSRLNVISDEALLLGSSIIINALVSFLRYLTDPHDANNNYYIEAILQNYLESNSESWQTPDKLRASRQIVLPDQFNELLLGFKSYSISELTEQIIKIFKLDLNKGEIVYLNAFRDLLQEYLRNHSSNLLRFLDFWEETGYKRSIAAPAGQDAIRVMTLHKSKGLEFTIVIIPYCTWDLSSFDRSFLWCRPVKEPFNKLPIIPVTFSRKLSRTVFSEDYFRELQKQMTDNLNLMYVAFTRAKDAMYIFCKEPKTNNLLNVSSLVKRVLGNSSEMGELTKPLPAKDTQDSFINYYTTGDANYKTRIKIAFQGELIIDPERQRPARPVNEGRILHEIFNRINRREDIRKAVSELHLQGKIAAHEKNRYTQLIEFAMNDLQVSTWFSGEWKIFNEAEIIIPGGEIRRPDRVMQRNNQTLVIDYKFGSKLESSYEKQVKDYALLLETLGCTGVEAYLWYVRLGKVVQVKL